MESEIIYQSSYNKTLETLERDLRLPDFSIEKVRNELRALYVYEDLGWAGRGMIKDAEISASIAAYEAFLVQLRAYEDKHG